MSGFLIGAIFIGFIWFIVSVNSKANAQSAFNTIDAAQPWIAREGIESSSVKFSAYNDQALARTPGASIIVAAAKKTTGDRVGFVIEVKPGHGVVEFAYIDPEGIITHHKRAAQMAKMHGLTLMETLQRMALEHRAKYPNR